MTIAAIGMQDDMARMSSISQNLANVSTPGYKRSIPVNGGVFLDHMHAAATAQGVAGVTDAVGPMLMPQVVIDPRAGTHRHTGNPLDIAIEGDGFFEVMTDKGPAYTRQGALHVDARGRLVTAQDLPIMGAAGELQLSGSSALIKPNGEVWQGDRLVGQLRLVHFANPQALTALGNGLFAQGEARIADTAPAPVVRIGYQENSNVNSPTEMVRLMETVRHFESMQKVVQGYDELLEKTIRKLGEF